MKHQLIDPDVLEELNSMLLKEWKMKKKGKGFESYS